LVTSTLQKCRRNSPEVENKEPEYCDVDSTKSNYTDRNSPMSLQHAQTFAFAAAQGSLLEREEDIELLFNRLAGGETVISFIRFKEACEEMEIDLSPEEYKRVFDTADIDDSGDITFDEFKMSINHGKLLMAVAGMHKFKSHFKVENGYDFKKTTNENYENHDKSQFVGKFSDIRSTLDYAYHVNYTPQRQFWQDKVIKTTTIRQIAQEHPWIVYTCGAMGAGKGYTMRWMSANDYFPLENVVRIDPDHFKMVMPEWEGYIRRDKYSAGSMTHRESGFIQEIAQEVALRSRQNIWVDGSLRDGNWFSKVFDDIRRRFPHYKIAIFYVFADEKIVRQRVEERGQRTGRFVSEENIIKSLKAPESSLNKLTPKVDFIARIDNSKSPVLTSFEVIDRSHCWERIRRFAQTEAAIYMFPNHLPPISVSRTPVDRSIWERVDSKGHHCVQVCPKALKDILPRLTHNELNVSTLARVTLKAHVRTFALIPEQATTFGFVYPSEGIKDRVDGKFERFDGIGNLYQNGGFVYYDDKGDVVGVNCLMSYGFSSTSNIRFHRPYTLRKRDIKELQMEHPWYKVQRPDMIAKGCLRFVFVPPGVRIGKHPNKYGAFAYEFEDSCMNRFFAIQS